MLRPPKSPLEVFVETNPFDPFREQEKFITVTEDPTQEGALDAWAEHMLLDPLQAVTFPLIPSGERHVWQWLAFAYTHGSIAPHAGKVALLRGAKAAWASTRLRPDMRARIRTQAGACLWRMRPRREAREAWQARLVRELNKCHSELDGAWREQRRCRSEISVQRIAIAETWLKVVQGLVAARSSFPWATMGSVDTPAACSDDPFHARCAGGSSSASATSNVRLRPPPKSGLSSTSATPVGLELEDAAAEAARLGVTDQTTGATCAADVVDWLDSLIKGPKS